MDPATIVGIVSGVALILIAIYQGGNLALFINIPSVMITVGGTIAATFINFPITRILKVLGVVKNAFVQKVQSPEAMIPIMVDFATRARREGILALESAAEEMDDVFLKTGIQLAVDGTEPSLVRDILDTELEYVTERHDLGAAIFEAMGFYAPAFGMIGTLIGLIQMLQTLDDPSAIGPAMAVALITTFYGALLANLICLPLAGKLKQKSKEENLRKELIIHGIVLIQSGENPRIVEQKLNSFLSPKLRKSAYK